MYRPLISIVIPVYNVEEYLPHCIESVLRQDYHDYEVVIVDDGSTDRSPEICDEYAVSDDRIRVIHKMNGGLGEARNTGLEAIKGDYVYFLDSDDSIRPETLSVFVDFMARNGDFSLIASDCAEIKEPDEITALKISGEDEVFENIQEVQNRFLKRSLIFAARSTLCNVEWMRRAKLRFKNVPFTEDILFIWECLKVAERVGYIHKTLYNYLQRPGSIMNSSKPEKMILSYPYFKSLQEKFGHSENLDAETRRFMLSRWITGVFHTASKLCSYAEYKELMKSCEGNVHIRNARTFPDIRVRILALIYRVSKRLYFQINRHI